MEPIPHGCVALLVPARQSRSFSASGSAFQSGGWPVKSRTYLSLPEVETTESRRRKSAPLLAQGRVHPNHAYIDSWAAQAKTFGRPMFVAWELEMNGTWFPWAGYFYGGGKELSKGGLRRTRSLSLKCARKKTRLHASAAHRAIRGDVGVS